MSALPRQGDSEEHRLRCLVAEALEVFAMTFVMLTESDPPRSADAANEIQQAYLRFAAELTKESA